MSSSSTRGRNANGAYSNTRGNANRRYGNSQDRRTNNGNNSTGSGTNQNQNQNQTRGWVSQNVAAGGPTLNARGGHQQRSSSYGGGFSVADLDAQKHMHDRLVYLLAKSIGCPSIVTVATGARYRGILVAATASGDIGAVLELAEKYANPPGEEDDTATPEKFDKIVFQAKDLVDIEIESPNLTVDKPTTSSAAASDFKTDTDISGQKGAIYERELERWSAGDDSLGLALEDTANSSQPWDQFAVNQSKFGVQSTYDEHLYTTVIDKSHPEYQIRERNAEKLAEEILKSAHNGNVHIAEERGLAIDDSGLDEEDKYSGVDRRVSTGNRPTPAPRDPSKYTPPALRQTAPKNTSKNVPYDPAIISSSLAPSEAGPRKVKNGTPVEVPSGGTSTPISDLFKASQGVTTDPVKSSGHTTTAPGSADKPLPPSVALPASARAKADKDTKPKGSGKTPTNPEAVQKGLAGDFKEFVSTEMEKVQLKKQYLHSKEKSDRIHDFKKFSQGYKINTPVPIDLVPILGKKRDSPVSYTKPLATKPSAPTASKSAPPPVIQPALPTSPLKTQDKAAPELSAKIAEAHKSDIPPKIPSPLPKKDIKPVPVVPLPAPKSSQPSPSSTPATSSPAPTEKKLNLNFKAPEFRPNPAAHSFTPSFAAPVSAGSSNHASPALPHSQPVHTPRQNRPGNFYFGNKTLCTKSMHDKFNPFLPIKEEGGNVIERAFLTPPTWPAPGEKPYTDFLPDSAQRQYYPGRGPMAIPPPSGAMGGAANMVPMMQPGFEDPNMRGMMGSSPPIPGQVAFIPTGMGYGQFTGAPQFYGRGPQPFPMPNMMGQQYMGFNPQQGGYQSPRGPQAMLVPAMNQGGFQMGGGGGYYSPQQQHQQPYMRNNAGPHNHSSRYNSSSHSGNTHSSPSAGNSSGIPADDGKA